MSDTESYVPTPARSPDGASPDLRLAALKHRLRFYMLLVGVLTCGLLLLGSAFFWRGAGKESRAAGGAHLAAGTALPGAARACSVPGCSEAVASVVRFQAFHAALAREKKLVAPWTAQHCERHSPYVCGICGRREGVRPETCASCGNLSFDIHCENVPSRFTQNPANQPRE